MELPTESPRKYGVYEDDFDELADALSGREPRKRVDPRGGFGVSHTDAVDEDFLRVAGNPRNHYGA